MRLMMPFFSHELDNVRVCVRVFVCVQRVHVQCTRMNGKIQYV